MSELQKIFLNSTFSILNSNYMAVSSRPRRRTGWAIADSKTVCTARLDMRYRIGFGLFRFAGAPVVFASCARQRLSRCRHKPIAYDTFPCPPRAASFSTAVMQSSPHRACAIRFRLCPLLCPQQRREPEERLAILKSLGFLLKMTPAEIEADLEDARRKRAGIYDPVAIVEDADLATITLIEENKWRLGRAVLVTDEH